MTKKCVVIVAILCAICISEGYAVKKEETEGDIAGRISGSCTADDGRLCLFPFMFKGKIYRECTFAGNATSAWCALEKNSNLEVIKSEWGNCDLSIGNCTVETPSNEEDCYTTGGPDIGKKCIFPFIHGGKEYHDCTSVGHKEGKLWCSTKVDKNGHHMAGKNLFGTCAKMFFWNSWSNWGKCSAFCGGVHQGSRERTRSCKQTNCKGNHKETRSCINMEHCGEGEPCEIGSTWKQDCNTCICTGKGKTMCTSNLCPVSPPLTPLTSAPSPLTSAPSPPPPPSPPLTMAPYRSTTPAPFPPPTAPPGSNICVTDSGPTSNHQCVFPFKWVGRTFNNCDVWRWGGKDEGKFWCSTKTDANGIHVNGQGNYGFCPHTEACRGVSLTVNSRLIDSNAPK